MPLNLAQRLVVVAALAGGLGVFGTWVTAGGSSFSGWVGYAPVSPYAAYRPGLQAWAHALIWLGFIVVWTVVSLWLLRGDAGAPRPMPLPAAPVTEASHQGLISPETKGSKP